MVVAGSDPDRAASCPQNNHQRHPYPCFPVINSIKFFPQFYRATLNNLAPSALQSKLANVELSDLSAETIHRVCSVPYHPHLLLLRLHGCISQAQMGFFRHEKQSMTCPKQWMADDEPAPFDGLCQRRRLFDVEEYKSSMIH